MLKLNSNDHVLSHLQEFVRQLDDYLQSKERQLNTELMQQKMIETIQTIYSDTRSIEHAGISERLMISLNNIQSSLCHSPALKAA